MTKKIALFLIGGTILLFALSIWYWQVYQKPTQINDQIKDSRQISREDCLTDNEIADYPINQKYAKEVKAPLNPLVISVRDKTTQQEKFSFQIDGINPDHYHPLELHKCGVYVTREFNFDPKTRRSTPNYRIELWKYNYSNQGGRVLLFSETDTIGKYKSYFNDDFRVDPNEKYLVLEKSYLGKDDYALIIKDIATLEDIFVLNLKNVLAERTDIIPGSFGMGTWTEDGRYLRGDIFQGALSTAYYQIEAGSWKTDIFAAPPDILAGVERAINYNNWRLAYVDIPTFTGVQEVYEQIIEKAKKEGKQKNLYVHNLRTKERIMVASTDPEKRFNIKWLSDTELEYTLLGGEIKTYTISK